MPIDEIKKVCFVGAGTMGSYNSLITAIHGYEAVLYDVSEDALEASKTRQDEWLYILVERGLFDRATVETGMRRVVRTTDPEEAARDADLLSESVFEIVEGKRETHSRFEALLPPHAIMTTNTSSLLASEIESVLENGGRFAAMHFHQPGRLVDLVAGPHTTARTIDVLKKFVRSQGQVPIVLKKEYPGYLHNAIYVRLLGTSQFVAGSGLASFEDVDRAWMANQNSEMGPFGMMDFVGLNLVADMLENATKNENSPKEAIAVMQALVRPYVERGELGLKTGKGFYTYPEPAFRQPSFMENYVENEDVSGVLLGAVFAPALILSIEGVGDPEEVDLCWMLTHNPKMGPFGMMDLRGLDVVKEEIEQRGRDMEMFAQHAQMISDFLTPYIKRGELGVKTGRGFYTYPDPAYQRPGFLNGKD